MNHHARNFKIVYCVMSHNSDRECYRADSNSAAMQWIMDKMEQPILFAQLFIDMEYYVRTVWTNVKE